MASQADTTDTPLNGDAGRRSAGQCTRPIYQGFVGRKSRARRRCSSGRATPQLDVQFNLNVNRVSDDVHEVILRIELKAASDQGTHFLVDLSYAGAVRLAQHPRGRARRPSCWSKPRACCSRSRARSSPTRSRTSASRRSCSTRSISARPIWRSSKPAAGRGPASAPPADSRAGRQRVSDRAA